MWSEVTDTLLDELRADPAVKARIESLEADVSQRPGVARPRPRGRCSPRFARGEHAARSTI